MFEKGGKKTSITYELVCAFSINLLFLPHVSIILNYVVWSRFSRNLSSSTISDIRNQKLNCSKVYEIWMCFCQKCKSNVKNKVICHDSKNDSASKSQN